MNRLESSTPGTYVRRCALGLCAAMLAVMPTAAHAFQKNHLPLNAQELSRRFSMKQLQAECVDGRLGKVGPNGAQLTLRATTAQLVGTDHAGGHWRVDTSGVRMGCSVWASDLDGNGARDLILATYTGGCGLAPPMHLVMVLFDGQGRPVPWQVDGYFEQDARGIKDVLDLDGNGRAEVVRMSFDDGYWITSPYEASAGSWERVIGPHAGRHYPLYTRFLDRPVRMPSNPEPGRSPFDADLTNQIPPTAKRTTITSVTWAKIDHSEDPTLTLADGRTCQPVAWSSTMAVVIDRTARRDAATLHAAERTRQLLVEIAARKLPVVVQGQRRKGQCSPELVWAIDR